MPNSILRIYKMTTFAGIDITYCGQWTLYLGILRSHCSLLFFSLVKSLPVETVITSTRSIIAAIWRALMSPLAKPSRLVNRSTSVTTCVTIAVAGPITLAHRVSQSLSRGVMRAPYNVLCVGDSYFTAWFVTTCELTRLSSSFPPLSRSCHRNAPRLWIC